MVINPEYSLEEFSMLQLILTVDSKRKVVFYLRVSLARGSVHGVVYMKVEGILDQGWSQFLPVF